MQTAQPYQQHRPGEAPPPGGLTGEHRMGMEHRPGELRPEQRPGELRPGEHRPGEQRPGEQLRPGELRPEHRLGEGMHREPGLSQRKRLERPMEAQRMDELARRYALSWAAALPVSLLTFLSSFFAAIVLPWLVVIVGALGLDTIIRRPVNRNLGADFTLHPMELMHNPVRFATKRLITFGVRALTVYFLGPPLMLGSLFFGGIYALLNRRDYQGSGLVLLSAVPGLVLTCLWWGFIWYLLTPLVYLGIGVSEFGGFVWNYMRVQGYLEQLQTGELPERMKEKGKEIMESGRERIERMSEKGEQMVHRMGTQAQRGADQMKERGAGVGGGLEHERREVPPYSGLATAPGQGIDIQKRPEPAISAPGFTRKAE